MTSYANITCALAIITVTASNCWSDQSSPATAPPPSLAPLDPTRAWVLIIVGHPGDSAYAEQFADIASRLGAIAHERLGVAEERICVWSGVDASDGTDAFTVGTSRGPATRETLGRDIAALREKLDKQTEFCVIVLGHGHQQGRRAALNLPGPDVDADEFASWFRDIPNRRSIFFITTSVSGAFVKPLAAPRRIVIAAATSDEQNATLFPLALIDQLESQQASPEGDDAKPRSISVLDLYLAVERDVTNRYTTETLIVTEHPQLDDNGDGRGTEIQLDPEKPARPLIRSELSLIHI